MGITGKFGFRGNNNKDNSNKEPIQSSIEQLLKSKTVEESVAKMGTAISKAKEVANTAKDVLVKKTEEQIKKAEEYVNKTTEVATIQETTEKTEQVISIQNSQPQNIVDTVPTHQFESEKVEEVIKEAAPLSEDDKYYKGIEYLNRRDFVNGYTLIDEAAKQGHSISQNQMGLAYLEGFGTEQNYFMAYYWFAKAAEQGNVYALYNIANMYLFGYGVEKNKEKALNWYEKASQAGHETSGIMKVMLKRELGLSDSNPTKYDLYNYAMFFWNQGEYEMAIKHAQNAINNGVNAAYHILGMAYEKGYGATIDFKKATSFYSMSVGDGLSESAFCLGRIYEFGRGGETNYQQALKYYQLASNLGDKSAQKAIEIVTRKINTGDRVSVQQGMSAEYYYQQAVQYSNEGIYGASSLYALYAARKGHVGATYMRAWCCRYGMGISTDIQEAIKLYKISLDGGIIDAALELGRIYEYGIGVEKNEEIAYDYYCKAKKVSIPNVINDIHRLINKNTYLYSVFMQEQSAQCRDAYEYKMENASRYQLIQPEEMMLISALGTAFNYGVYDEFIRVCTHNDIDGKSYQKAKENLEKYIQYGAGDISLNITELDKLIECERKRQYFENKEDEELFSLAETAEENQFYYLSLWYGEILAKRGSAVGQSALGIAYLEGSLGKDVMITNEDTGEVVYNRSKLAFEWLSKAAEQQEVTACYYLGLMYANGEYVDKDLVKAKRYFEKAAKEEVEGAEEALANVKQEMKELGIEDTSPTQEIQSKTIKTVEDLPENIDDYFEGIIGLGAVKKQLDTIYQAVKVKLLRDKILQERGEDAVDSEQGFNFVLLGNPGTGKTMVARIIAKILFDIGVRSTDEFIEVDRSKLLSEHYGGTEKNVRDVIEKTGNGTLFVDEAHTLFREDSENDFGQEAIDTLLKEMEDRRGQFSVILAGYKKPMMNMMKNANSGFASRFTYIIDLPDYTETELITIANTLIEQKKYVTEEGVDDAIRKCINRDRIDDTFGNARYIRELVDRAIRNMAVRINSSNHIDEDMLFILKAEDFWNGEPEENVQTYLAELNSLIGLPAVKKEVSTLTNRITVQAEMERRGIKGKQDFGTLHMAFKGNPGTGKTTVARIIGKLYASLGILKRKDVFVECSRATLVGQYQGSTAINVKKAVDAAMGGILFVDEAYSLVKGEGDTFGKEAVDTLVAEMENNRNNLIVIFAGYSRDIDEFFMNNQGLKSRVPIELVFEDYTSDELFEIACKMICSNNYNLDSDAETKLHDLLIRESFKPDFGNARGVRNIVESCIRNQNDRIATMLSNSNEMVTDEMLTIIKIEDIG